MTETTVRRAGVEDLEAVTPLFSAYRVFYNREPALNKDRTFLRERLEAGESVVLVAERDGRAVGFTQLYPTFSSVALARDWILNDLYVAQSARGAGVGAALLEAARDFGRSTGARRLVLETQPDNEKARRLYERLGWRRDHHLHFWIECR